MLWKLDKMQEIKHFLRIRVTPDKTYQALTTEEGLRGWWTEGAKGKSENGAVIEFKFGEHGTMNLKVSDLEEDKRVVWEGVDADNPWKGTKIAFSLEGEGDNTTILRFMHSGWKEDADREMLDNINYNWGRFLFSLKTFCETKKGFPVKVD